MPNPAAGNTQPTTPELVLTSKQMDSISNFSKHLADINRATPEAGRMDAIALNLQMGLSELGRREEAGEDVAPERMAFMASALGALDDRDGQYKLINDVKASMSEEEARLFESAADELGHIKQAVSSASPEFAQNVEERFVGNMNKALAYRQAGKPYRTYALASQAMFAGAMRDQSKQKKMLDAMERSFMVKGAE